MCGEQCRQIHLYTIWCRMKVFVVNQIKGIVRQQCVQFLFECGEIVAGDGNWLPFYYGA